MVVLIPKVAEHAGYDGNLIKVEISDLCPICKGPRAARAWKGISYDGSRRLNVDCWMNACGHIDKYADVMKEGKLVPWDTPTITDAKAPEIKKSIEQTKKEAGEHLLDEDYNKELTVEHDPDLHAPSIYDEESPEP